MNDTTTEFLTNLVFASGIALVVAAVILIVGLVVYRRAHPFDDARFDDDRSVIHSQAYFLHGEEDDS